MSDWLMTTVWGILSLSCLAVSVLVGCYLMSFGFAVVPPITPAAYREHKIFVTVVAVVSPLLTLIFGYLAYHTYQQARG